MGWRHNFRGPERGREREREEREREKERERERERQRELPPRPRALRSKIESVIEPGHSAVASHVAIWLGISLSVVLPMVDPENGYGINKLTGKHIDDDIILRRPCRHGFTAEQPHNTSMFYLMWVFGLVSRSTLRAGPPANHHGPPTTDEPIAPP